MLGILDAAPGMDRASGFCAIDPVADDALLDCARRSRAAAE
jgi:hypothetical protein